MGMCTADPDVGIRKCCMCPIVLFFYTPCFDTIVKCLGLCGTK